MFIAKGVFSKEMYKMWHGISRLWKIGTVLSFVYAQWCVAYFEASSHWLGLGMFVVTRPANGPPYAFNECITAQRHFYCEMHQGWFTAQQRHTSANMHLPHKLHVFCAFHIVTHIHISFCAHYESWTNRPPHAFRLIRCDYRLWVVWYRARLCEYFIIARHKKKWKWMVAKCGFDDENVNGSGTHAD